MSRFRAFVAYWWARLNGDLAPGAAQQLGDRTTDALAGEGGAHEGFAPRGAYGYDEGRPRR